MQGTDITSAVYIGALGKEARKEAEKADVLLATTQIAKEALNIPDLDTLFIASPFSSAITTEQSVGRILRACDDKMEPMVIDFVDEDFISIKLARKRYYTYQRLKYDIKLIGGTKL
jgi:superfamily II DNA or RNA helicase